MADGDFVIAKVNNKEVKIPLGLERPNFQNYNSFEEWLDEERRYAVALKDRVERGEILPRTVRKEMINWSKRTKRLKKNRETLKTEKLFLDIDMNIKGRIDAKRCLKLLIEVQNIKISSLKKKKQPNVKKVQRFKEERLDKIEVKAIISKDARFK